MVRGTITRLRVRTASVQTQTRISRGRLPKGSVLPPVAVMYSVYGPFRRLYWSWLPGWVRGREHSAIIRDMNPMSASASRAATSWFT